MIRKQFWKKICEWTEKCLRLQVKSKIDYIFIILVRCFIIVLQLMPAYLFF